MYSKKEELWNVLTHGFGILLSIAALILLLVFQSGKSAFSLMSVLFYATTLLFLYSASTLYHWISKPSLKHLFRKLDHIGIYALIAGTYTPIVLISLIDGNGWLLFGIVWGIAALGTLLKIFFTGRFEKLSLALYLAMGWLIVFDIQSVLHVQSTMGLILLALGGVFYSLGTIFYMNEKIPYNHAIWHCFVLAGSISHFFFIFFDVI